MKKKTKKLTTSFSEEYKYEFLGIHNIGSTYFDAVKFDFDIDN